VKPSAPKQSAVVPSLPAAPAREAPLPSASTQSAVTLPTEPSSVSDARQSKPIVGRGTAPSSASDALLVQQAIEALRNDGDAERATQLLEKYRKKGQNQALSEEALALSIEAALVNDPARAKRLAEQYLRTYPRGRFKQLAERAAGH
jgi:hypothetical protein